MAAIAENKRYENVIPILHVPCVGPMEPRCEDEITELMERIWRESCIGGHENWGRYREDGHFELGQRLGGGVGKCGCGYTTQFTDYILSPKHCKIDRGATVKLSKAKLIDDIKDRVAVFGYTYESLNKMKKVELIDLVCPKYSINCMGMHKLIYHRSQIPGIELAKIRALIDIYNDDWMVTTYAPHEIEELKFN